ncbi:MAG: LysR family transcriptional regulator [Alphaproteobacteria bacterium]|nr:LysR family transcriptional regulator [Alphaproteobacteria bacterium]
MDWEKLKTFHTVAIEGSFTHAGRALGLSQSAVSRQISALEEGLRAPLFHRHVRGLVLTEQGEVLFRAARKVAAELAMAEGVLGEATTKPGGPLKVTTTVGFGTTWLAPRVGSFIAQFPDIRLQLVVVDDRELDLAMREADVAIRMRAPTQPGLIKRPLMTVRNHIYGARQYLSRHGTPRALEDLATHRLIIYGEDMPGPSTEVNWLITVGTRKGTQRHATLEVNSVFGMLLAAESALGLAGLPDYMVGESRGLLRVLPEIAGPEFRGYFVYPEGRRNSARITAFRDFLIAEIAASPELSS